MPPAGVPCVGPRLLGAGRLAVRSVREVASGLPAPAPAVQPHSGGGSSGSLASGFGISPAVCDVASPGFGDLCSPLDSVVVGSDLIVEKLVSGGEIACVCELSPVVVDVPDVVPSGFGAQSELVGASDFEAVAGVVGSGPALGGVGAATGCLYASGLGLTSGTDSVSCEIGLGVAGGCAGSLISGEVEVKNGLSHVDGSPCSELGGCNSDGKAAMCAGTVGFAHGKESFCDANGLTGRLGEVSPSDSAGRISLNSVFVNEGTVEQNGAQLTKRGVSGDALGVSQVALPAAPVGVEGGCSRVYASALNGPIGVDHLDSSVISNALHYVKLSIIDGQVVVCSPVEIFEEGSEYWWNTLVDYFV